ncbi:MAG TPA: hypothetical protein VGO36_02055 [Solirubrobacterales bacterium]|jgi:hypothetical protein|nr:hypothetical protein [Solirubrobacterales bacterium]
MSKRQPGKSDSTDASAYSRRAALADSAWSAQDRVRSGSGRALRATGEAVSSPLERVDYSLRKKLIWPAADRAATIGRPGRALASAAVVLLAAGAGVAGLVWAAPDGPHQQTTVTRLSEASAPIASAETTAPKPAEPTLHGATPVFKPGQSPAASPEADPAKAVVKSSAEPSAEAAAPPAAATSSAPAATSSSSSSARKGAQVDGPPAGPAALAVADQFAAAFLRYETGGSDPAVRGGFAATATPELAQALLKRPPRLPANVKVPKAKVLNVVPAPSNAGVFPVSVSLLRVGVTSELRLQMEKLKGDGWRVTNVLG